MEIIYLLSLTFLFFKTKPELGFPSAIVCFPSAIVCFASMSVEFAIEVVGFV